MSQQPKTLSKALSVIAELREKNTAQQARIDQLLGQVHALQEEASDSSYHAALDRAYQEDSSMEPNGVHMWKWSQQCLLKSTANHL